MGRVRKKADQWMPPRTYYGKAAIEWHPKDGGAIRLCELTANKATVWKRYEEERAKYNASCGSFGELSAEYKSSPRFRELAIRTQKDYARYSKIVGPVFDKMLSNNIKPEHMRQYLDVRGEETKVQANREFSYMSTVFSWGFQRGKCAGNPCNGVSKFKEKSRERYITDEEYLATLKHAPLSLKIAMEIAYLCAARVGDVLKLSKTQLQKKGIFIEQGKTNRKQIKGWNPRLRSVIALAKKLPGVDSFYVIHRENGDKYSYSMNYNRWVEAKAKAGKELGYKLDFTYHDLKAKGVSDYGGDKQLFADHATPAQTRGYDRIIKVVEALNLPNIHESENTK